jgi:hypothetical protein
MKKFFFSILIMICTIANVNAQDSASNAHKWSFLVEPYLMFPSMSGTTGIGTLPPVDVNVNSNQIFSNLKFGAMLFFEARKGDWAFNSDLLYMSLGQDVKTGTVINSGNIAAKQLGWEVAGLLQITPWLELGPALMLNSVKMDVDITVNNIGGGTTARSNGLSQTWGDVLLVARIKSKEGEKFMYQLRGDIGGGFGASKNSVWQVQAYAGYRFSKLFQLTGGYRIIGLDYEKGTGSDYFLFDMNTSGPVIRFGFNL